jgi:Family of unknown function (DUF6459)
MRTLPPDPPGAPPPAAGEHAPQEPGGGGPPGEHALGDPEGAGPDGPVSPWCPRPHTPSRPRTSPRPLPDPAAVRLCLIPDSAPPYDAEAVPDSAPPCDAEAAAAGAPGTTGAAGPVGRTGPAAAELPGQAGRRPGSPGPRQPPARPPAPSPGWPGQFAQALAETLAGSRPPRQLVPWTTERARERIQRLGPQLSAGQQPRVRRVVTFYPTADALEMTVVVAFGMRVRALAVRLERTGGGQAAAGRPGPARWLCTTVEAA